MASVPNTRVSPSPVPSGQIPAGTAGAADFAKQFAEIPEELLKISAGILAAGGDVPAPDGATDDGTDAPSADPADATTDAAQLAALVPLLQSLPAVVAAPAATATPAPATMPNIETSEAKAPAATAMPLTTTPVATTPLTPTTVATTPATTKSVTAKPVTATPVSASPVTTGQPATGKIQTVKPDAESDETGADPGPGRGEAQPALDATAKEAIVAAKRVIEAALRAAGPALAEAAPKVARAVASALQTVSHSPISPRGAGADAPVADIAAAAALAMPAGTAPATNTAIQPRETAAPAAAPVSGPPLDLANDAEWLDRLARDIAQASGNEGTIRFRLHPQTLGHLRVELSQGDHGTSIRLTADTEQARAILADAQPRLVAEARAQGVRIAETHVDLSGSDRQFSGDPRRQDDGRQTPLIRTARDAAAGADAHPRPARSRSDRYA
jgi:flagellar hook-length control protein FliK